jgi:hypothetical protein
MLFKRNWHWCNRPDFGTVKRIEVQRHDVAHECRVDTMDLGAVQFQVRNPFVVGIVGIGKIGILPLKAELSRFTLRSVSMKSF